MKKTINILKISKFLPAAFIFALFSVSLTSCEYLQSTLSSVQTETLLEQTGKPVYSYKSWYYNGFSGEDMSEISDSSSVFYGVQNLRIDFGQVVALTNLIPSGKIVISYTDSEGNAVSKTVSSLSGSFSADYKSYFLDMSCVTGLMDGNTTSAVVDLKVSGFVCAEGRQNGRPVNAFELSSLPVRPLFNAVSFDFSTVGYGTQTKYEIPLNGKVSLEGGNYTATGYDASDNEYEFFISAENKSIFLVPEFSKPADNVRVSLKLENILPEGCGTAYSKEIYLTFVEHLIVLDGREDANWNSDYAVSVEDESKDNVALGDDGILYNSDCDITKLSVTNDEDYFYIAIKGSLASSWSDGFGIMINKNHAENDAYTAGKGTFALADSVGFGRESLAHGKPDFYLYHKPQSDTIGAWVVNASSNSAENSFADSAVSGDNTFIEYAVPVSDLSKAGITSGDTVYVAAVFSAHWSAGTFASDIVPDSAASSINESHSTVTFNFKNALSYQIK